MEYSQILINQIFIMFLLIGTGFFLYQKKIFTKKETKIDMNILSTEIKNPNKSVFAL